MTSLRIRLGCPTQRSIQLGCCGGFHSRGLRPTSFIHSWGQLWVTQLERKGPALPFAIVLWRLLISIMSSWGTWTGCFSMQFTSIRLLVLPAGITPLSSNQPVKTGHLLMSLNSSWLEMNNFEVVLSLPRRSKPLDRILWHPKLTCVTYCHLT